MKDKILKFWPVLIIFLLVVIFSFPYWGLRLIPIPANHLVTAFPPWQYYYGMPVKNNAMPDVVTQMYPWKHLVISLWRNQQIPLWNPYNFSGNPFLGNYQSAVFHPFNFLFFILPEIDAWSCLILLQPLLAGLFTYLFCRQLKLSQIASFLSAVAFMFSGFITTWMAYGTMSYALLWLPLILYGIQKTFSKIKGWPLSLISFALAASFFSGHFQTSLYVLLASLAFLVFKLVIERQSRIFFLCLVFIILGVLLASVQILPTYELHQLSVRSKVFSLSEIIPWSYLITLFAPDFYGNPVTRNDWFGHYAEWASFIGVIPLFLAIYVIFRKKDPMVWFFALLGIFCLSLALPTPLLEFLENTEIPVFSSSSVSRIIGLFSFLAAILAGLGLDRLKEDLDKKKFARIFLVMIILVLFFLGVWWSILVKKPFEANWLLVAKRNFILPTGMVLAFFGLVFAYWLIGKIFKKKKKLILYTKYFILILILLLATFDLFRFAKKWMPFDSKKYLYPSLPVIEFLNNTLAYERLFGNFGMEMQNYYQVPGFGGYDPLYIQRYGELLMAVNDGKIRHPPTRGVELEKRGQHTNKLLNLFGGKYILHAIPDDRHVWAFPYWEHPDQFDLVYEDNTYQVYQNLKASPRAFLAYDYYVAEHDQEVLDQMFAPETDLREKIILEEEPELRSRIEPELEPRTIRDRSLAAIQDRSLVSIVKYSPNQVEIKVQTKTPGLLFLSDNYYPGWKALIDGKETKIYRADYTFRAVPVPAGEHEVKFTYNPPSFKWGLRISLFALAMLVMASFWLGRFRK